MNAACSTATPSAAASSPANPPLPSTASTAAHFRLGRRSRRGSSSGASSTSSGGAAATVGSMSIANGRRKRRRHSTLSSGIASGSDDELERAPPTFRLRLGSYVSDFRLGSTRSSSPSSQLNPGPLSPPGAVRQRHQLRIETSALGAQHERSDRVATAVSPTTTSSAQAQTEQDDAEMDLDVQSTFQAMQVDSPTTSPLPSVHSSSTSFFAATSSAMLTSQRPSPCPIPAGLLSPLNTDTQYPVRSPSPLASSASFASISLVSHTNTAAVSPAVFPSLTLLAARRNSRQSCLGMNPNSSSQQQHTPASPSPLARTISFQSTHHYTQPSALSHAFVPHPHPHPHPASSLQHSTSPSQFESSARSRSNSTPPSPIATSSNHPDQDATRFAVVSSSPLRRHSDGMPSPRRNHL